MRIAAWLVFAILASSLLAEQVKAPNDASKAKIDPYHLIFVKSAFDSFKASENHGVISGGQIKQFTNNFPSLTQLGDSVSVAVLKLYSLGDLMKPENTRPYLTIVSLSFSDGNRVIDETDRTPHVTSLVLDFLQQRVSDQRTKTIIDTLKQCTNTCSCPRIPNF